MGLLATTGLAADLPRRFDYYPTIQESLRSLPPNIGSYRLEKAGYDLWPAAHASAESSGLSLVGKWGGGPSYRVTGRDSIVYLSRGSQVAIINHADTANPRVLSYIEAPGLVAKSVLVGNRLYVSSGYIETFDVSDPTDPLRLGSVLARAPAIDVVDTLVYTLYRDSFKVLDFADPANPQMLGACRDSGYDLSVCDGYAYIGDGGGLYVLDVRNPASPHRIGSWGGDVLSVKARGDICCATTENPSNPGELTFTVLDVRNPATPTPLGSIDSCGAYDIFLCDTLAFLSGYYTGGHVFRILDISDSTHPTSIGSCPTRHEHLGVWANVSASRAYVADFLEGLSVVDIANLTSPRLDTSMLAAGLSEDVAIEDTLAFVASEGCGMKILDVSNPARPHELGTVDSTRDMVTQAVAVQDSFAYMGWAPDRPWLRSIDVSDPFHPTKAGGAGVYDFPQGLVVRDSFLYVAQSGRFQIVNVARPREPVLVGSCAGDGMALAVRDSLAYTAAGAIRITNVARADSPFVVSTIGGHSATGLAVRDTFLYIPYVYDTLFSYSVADPAHPRLLSAVQTGVWPWDITLGQRTAYLALSDGYGVEVFDLADPGLPVRRGRCDAPGDIRRLSYNNGLVYAALWEAGVAIYETTSVGVREQPATTERPAGFRVWPTVTCGSVRLAVDATPRSSDMSVYDVSGSRLRDVHMLITEKGGAAEGVLDLSRLGSGVYVLVVESDGRNFTAKVVKTNRR
jgi:hypothetical protein